MEHAPKSYETRLFIDGEFVPSKSGASFPTVNPSTEEVICNVSEAKAEDVDAAVRAFAPSAPWRTMGGPARRDLMLKLADLMEREKNALAYLETLDNGKPFSSTTGYGSEVDIMLATKVMRYYAGWADKMGGQNVMGDDDKTLILTFREAVGPIGCIIPWNFPILMAAWKLGPALCCGCTVVLKTSEKTPLSALFLAQLIQEAGFPKGVVNVLSGDGPTAGRAIASHMRLTKVAFTGSTITGQKIMTMAVESNMKRVSLELGGKSALIVLGDADLNKATDIAQVGLFLNQGQCCCASSRVFVHASIYDAFLVAAKKAAEARVLGSPFEAKTSQGPQVDKLQFDKVLGYIQDGKGEGARLVTGGASQDGKGFFIQPTIFADVTDQMKIAREEIFGPVMCVIKFDSDDEVIERANASEFGLAAGIISTDVPRAMRIARNLTAGTVWINSYDNFDAAAPFGGFKSSGHGREKGENALESYTEIKCVMMPLA